MKSVSRVYGIGSPCGGDSSPPTSCPLILWPRLGHSRGCSRAVSRLGGNWREARRSSSPSPDGRIETCVPPGLDTALRAYSTDGQSPPPVAIHYHAQVGLSFTFPEKAEKCRWVARCCKAGHGNAPEHRWQVSAVQALRCCHLLPFPSPGQWVVLALSCCARCSDCRGGPPPVIPLPLGTPSGTCLWAMCSLLSR